MHHVRLSQGSRANVVVDAYSEFLGISIQRRPLAPHQLLEIDANETNPNNIRAAAERQLARLQPLTTVRVADAWNDGCGYRSRGRPTGGLATSAAELMAEVFAARDSLLDLAAQKAGEELELELGDAANEVAAEPYQTDEELTDALFQFDEELVLERVDTPDERVLKPADVGAQRVPNQAEAWWNPETPSPPAPLPAQPSTGWWDDESAKSSSVTLPPAMAAEMNPIPAPAPAEPMSAPAANGGPVWWTDHADPPPAAPSGSIAGWWQDAGEPVESTMVAPCEAPAQQIESPAAESAQAITPTSELRSNDALEMLPAAHPTPPNADEPGGTSPCSAPAWWFDFAGEAAGAPERSSLARTPDRQE